MGGIILAILGALIVILAVVNNRMVLFGAGVSHLNLYIAIVGAIVLVVGAFMWFRGRNAAA
jgi:hypothetical protein